MRKIKPPKNYTPEQVKTIRETTGLSQNLFAWAIGVPPKTLRNWEQGLSKPNVAASRILYAVEMDSNILKDYVSEVKT